MARSNFPKPLGLVTVRSKIGKYTICYTTHLSLSCVIEISGHRAVQVRSQAEIADLVRETRGRLGLTQTELAQKLGVSYQSVNRSRERAEYAFTDGIETN